MFDKGSAVADIARKAVAESLGTFLLVFVAVGTAVFGLHEVGALGIALAFGLVLLALAYSIGAISGCHVNPAVTLGVLLRGGISATQAVVYWGAQFVGGLLGGAALKLMTSDFGDVRDQTETLGSNGWGDTISGSGAFALEVVLTFLLVFVVLLVTGRDAAPGFAGLAIGLVLTGVHLVGIPLTGTSVNPARSLGPAVFAGREALEHVWLFLVAPLVGAILAAAVAALLESPAPDLSHESAEADPTDAAVPR